MSMSDRMETYSAKSYLRHTIGMFGIEAVHTALDELCKEEYNYLKKIYGTKEVKAQVPQQAQQEAQQEPQQVPHMLSKGKRKRFQGLRVRRYVLIQESASSRSPHKMNPLTQSL